MGNFLIEQRAERQKILAERDILVAELETKIAELEIVNVEKCKIETKIAELGDFTAVENELAEIQELIYQVGLETRPEQSNEETVDDTETIENTEIIA